MIYNDAKMKARELFEKKPTTRARARATLRETVVGQRTTQRYQLSRWIIYGVFL